MAKIFYNKGQVATTFCHLSTTLPKERQDKSRPWWEGFLLSYLFKRINVASKNLVVFLFLDLPVSQ